MAKSEPIEMKLSYDDRRRVDKLTKAIHELTRALRNHDHETNEEGRKRLYSQEYLSKSISEDTPLFDDKY